MFKKMKIPKASYGHESRGSWRTGVAGFEENEKLLFTPTIERREASSTDERRWTGKHIYPTGRWQDFSGTEWTSSCNLRGGLFNQGNAHKECVDRDFNAAIYIRRYAVLRTTCAELIGSSPNWAEFRGRMPDPPVFIEHGDVTGRIRGKKRL